MSRSRRRPFSSVMNEKSMCTPQAPASMTLDAASTYSASDVVLSKRPDTAALIAILSDTSHLGCSSAPAMNWYSSISRLAASQRDSFSTMVILDTGSEFRPAKLPSPRQPNWRGSGGSRRKSRPLPQSDRVHQDDFMSNRFISNDAL